MPSGIRIKQHDASDCGAACLASVAAYYRQRIPVSRIRQYAGTDRNGTNLAGMMEAAEKTGFNAKGVKADINTLSEAPLPAIAHIVKGSWHHFVVIYRIRKKSIRIMNPSTGEMEKWTKECFSASWTGILLLVIPAVDCEQFNSGFSIWHRFYSLIKPHRPIVIQSIAGALIYSILGVGISVYVEKLIDHVIPGSNSRLLNIMSISLLLIIIFRVLTGLMKSLVMLKTGQKTDAMLIMAYYRHLLRLPLSFFESMRTGEIISRINDAVKIRAFINTIGVEIMVNMMIITFSFILMFIYSGRLAFYMLMIIPVLIIVYYIFNRLNKKYLRKVMEQSAEFESNLVESIHAAGSIKRFGNAWKEILRFESKLVPFLKTSYKVNMNTILTNHFNELLSQGFLLILLWAGTYKIFNRGLTAGELMSFYSLFGYLLQPLSGLILMNRYVQDALIAADRLFQIFDLQEEISGNIRIHLPGREIERLKADDITFRYGSGLNVLEDFNIEIRKGFFTGIVGESGSGKSTLINLLQGIYQPNRGKIFIGDFDLKYVSKDSLQSLVSCVPQHIDMFSGTITENIALSVQKPDMGKIIRLCKMVGADDMLKKLPEGLYTVVGKNGTRFSGGEEQKIALARALYNDPEILLLDEPGSSLDFQSEIKLIKLLHDLKNQGKTIVLVTHRLSSIEKCDIVFLIKGGRIAEQGKHQDLIDMKGQYYSLWKSQFGIS